MHLGTIGLDFEYRNILFTTLKNSFCIFSKTIQKLVNNFKTFEDFPLLFQSKSFQTSIHQRPTPKAKMNLYILNIQNETSNTNNFEFPEIYNSHELSFKNSNNSDLIYCTLCCVQCPNKGGPW